MDAMTQNEKKNESKSKPDAMTQDEKNDVKSKPDAMVQDESQNGNDSERKSKVATLIKELDAIFIKHGLGKPVPLKPEPNHHRVIIRFQGKKKD